MNSMYYATLLTMAEHAGRPDLRAKALGRMTAELGDGAAVIVHDGDTVLSACRRARGFLGLEVVGASILSVFHVTRHASLATMRPRIRSGSFGAWSGRTVFASPGGEPIAAEVYAEPIVFDGEPALRVVIRVCPSRLD